MRVAQVLGAHAKSAFKKLAFLESTFIRRNYVKKIRVFVSGSRSANSWND